MFLSSIEHMDKLACTAEFFGLYDGIIVVYGIFGYRAEVDFFEYKFRF